jgi:ribonuclease E
MSNKMLIDATHPEETRVVVLRGNRVEEFDFESASRKQLRGNIYLAKVTRVEPSLQAAFVDYGGNRHGFLAFSEIHPDYYQIPVADRQALLEDERRAERDEDDEGNGGGSRERRGRRGRHSRRGAHRNRNRDVVRSDAAEAPQPDVETQPPVLDEQGEPLAVEQVFDPFAHEHEYEHAHEQEPAREQGEPLTHDAFTQTESTAVDSPAEAAAHEPPFEYHDTAGEPDAAASPAGDDIVEAIAEAVPQDVASHAEESDEHAEDVDEAQAHSDEDEDAEDSEDGEEEEETVESVGGDAIEEVMERAPRYRRHYKIQEVIKRRQVMLVQVVKEERGTKGAALTTYLSLAGRYSVLMPNTARGGGISRKVTNAEDRKTMKEIAEELEVPEGMGVILRTAGAARTKIEIKRDFEYLLRLWETVRDLTLNSTAPTLVYEEGSLVKRAIRDLYHKDIEEIVVEGEAAYREAKDFMRMLMPSHVKNVVPYSDAQPIFTRYGIESQLDAMFQPTVQLKSGGYVVINQTEALVAIDVNSGRATREHSIEDTATKTNMEAAAEIARQLRLRDLAGLIVIDFIDMDEGRNNRSVERKLKESLKTDRARIQVGRISHFGLMEMSRQRIRSSVLESSTETCPQCGGTGHVRAVASVALQLVRAVEETLLKGATHNLIVRSRSDVAIYVLNHKRAHLRMLEERFKISIAVTVDPTLTGHPSFAIDRGEQVMSLDQAKAIAATIRPDSIPAYAEDEDVDEVADDVLEAMEAEGEEGSAESAEGADRGGRRKRRRGRRGRGRSEQRAESDGDINGAELAEAAEGGTHDMPHELGDAEIESEGEASADGEESAAEGDGERRKRRRGRRGGRRNRRSRDDNGEATTEGIEAEGEDGIAASGEEPMPAEPFAAPTLAPEAEVPQPASEPEHAEMPAPAQAMEPESAPEPEQQRRRRSTVREAPPVPSAGAEPAAEPASEPMPVEPAPAPVPPVAVEAESEAGKPRRMGWWRRG